jgi:hypothetical protein
MNSTMTRVLEKQRDFYMRGDVPPTRVFMTTDDFKALVEEVSGLHPACRQTETLFGMTVFIGDKLEVKTDAISGFEVVSR